MQRPVLGLCRSRGQRWIDAGGDGGGSVFLQAGDDDFGWKLWGEIGVTLIVPVRC